MARGVERQIAGSGSGAARGMAEQDTYEIIGVVDEKVLFVFQLVFLGTTMCFSTLPSNIARDVFITSFVFTLVTLQWAGILLQYLASKPAPMPRPTPLCNWLVGITMWLVMVAYFLDYVHLTSIRAMRPISGGEFIAAGVASFCSLAVTVCTIVGSSRLYLKETDASEEEKDGSVLELGEAPSFV